MDTRMYTIQYGRSSQFTVVVQEEELAALVEADLVEIKPNMLNRTDNAILKFLVERPDKQPQVEPGTPGGEIGVHDEQSSRQPARSGQASQAD